MAIPKKLFDMACEELIPLIPILKITVLVSFAFIAFSLAVVFSFELGKKQR